MACELASNNPRVIVSPKLVVSQDLFWKIKFVTLLVRGSHRSRRLAGRPIALVVAIDGHVDPAFGHYFG